jgi:hypothetical protein
MEFDEYMNRYWRGFKPNQRKFVEEDPLYQIHLKSKDIDNTCARAEEILKNPKLLKSIVSERTWKEYERDFLSS